MAEVEVFVFLLVAVALLAGLANRIDLPYPVVLVLGGLGLGFVPGLPAPALEPDLVFFVFLPPLLYSAAFLSSAYELRDEARPIGLLAIGLVLLTVAGIAAAAHWLLGLPWAPAFVLGAVLGPTDPISATAVLQRLGAPARLRTILEGEALINDGTGLTAYNIAVMAAGAAALTAWEAGGRFVLVALGGVAIGVAGGLLAVRLRRFVTSGGLDVTLSLLTPFAVYVLAEELHVSGVLAVVTAGLIVGLRSLEVVEADTRLRTMTFWQALSFVLNALLFLLIGLQLRSIVEGIEGATVVTLALQAVLIGAVAMALRMAWMFALPGLFNLLAPLTRLRPSVTTRSELLVVGWSGMRGGVSLAAALAIPVMFPERSTVIVLAYGAVILTLVLPTLTLPRLIAATGVGEDEEHVKRENEARIRLAEAALETLDAAARAAPRSERAVWLLRARYEARLERAQTALDHGRETSEDAQHAEELAHAAIDAQRDLLRSMRSERAQPADTLLKLERELDLEESRLRSRAEG